MTSLTLQRTADPAENGARAMAEGVDLLAFGAAMTPSGMLSQSLSKAAELDHPPSGKFVEVDGVRLHYIERGTGIPVVMLHGNGTMACDFEISSLLGLAAEKYRVIAFDRPGYGYSERPRDQVWTSKQQAALLSHALQAIGADDAIVVGHSWGTMVAVSLALDHPDRVRSLVLLSGYYYPTPRLDVLLLSPPAVPGLGDVIRPTVSPLIGWMMWPALIQKFFSPALVTPRWQAEYPVWMSLRPLQILASATETALMTSEAFQLAQRYQTLKMPVVIMAGMEDIHVSTGLHSEQLHRQIPHGTLILVPGTGHMIHHIVPEQVLEAIDAAAA